MSAAAALLDRLGRPGGVRLGSARTEPASRLSTGLPELDGVLDGGLPRGRVSELAGPRSTGRTGLACAIAASATRSGETIAWVDPENSLDPEAVAAAGVVLGRTLWVRPRGVPDALRAVEVLLRAGGFGLVVLDLGDGGERHVRLTPRLQQAAEQTRTTLLIAATRRVAGTFAALGLEIAGRRVRWSRGPGRLTLLDGIDAHVTVVRNRTGRPGGTLTVRQACA